MAERRIENIDHLGQESKGSDDTILKTALSAASEPTSVLEPLVDIHYPDPTALSLVLRDVAKWSGLAFVLEPQTNVRLQIFSPRKQSLSQAYELFLVALSVVNLRAIQQGHVVKIVPVQYTIVA